MTPQMSDIMDGLEGRAKSLTGAEHDRNHAGTAVDRYRHLIGPELRARNRSACLGDVPLAVQALNRTIRRSVPVSTWLIDDGHPPAAYLGPIEQRF